jgi:4-amino-4-deoxy-L-arabinose transferase-like glycosyltransferase
MTDVPPARPALGRALVTLFLVALATRLAFVAVMPREILWPDGREFLEVARSLRAHEGFGLQTLRPPGYPAFMAGVFAVTGEDLLALRVVEAVLGAVSVVLIAGVGVAAFGVTAGVVSGAIAALHPVLSFLPSTQYSENVLVFVLVLALGAMLAGLRRDGLLRWIACGALLGIACLVRPNVILLVPGLLLGCAIALSRARRSWFVPALACLLALAAVVSPWELRNHRVHGRWYFVATGGGRQFWLGNNPGATGSTTIINWLDAADQDTFDRLPDDIARERWLYGRGMEFVRTQPGRAAQLYLLKLRNLFALWPEPLSRKVTIDAWGRSAQACASVVIYAGAILALVRRRNEPAMWPLVLGIVSFALVNAVFFTVMRYRVAFEPSLLWLAGAGWSGLPAVERLGRRLGFSR